MATNTAMPPTKRIGFYRWLDPFAMATSVEDLHALVPNTSATTIEPARRDDNVALRLRLIAARQLITAREAERRVK